MGEQVAARVKERNSRAVHHIDSCFLAVIRGFRRLGFLMTGKTVEKEWKHSGDVP